ncbi:MAG TPA: hypothetical protein VHG08_25585 [Longimicrobium sp.]|nr:hypothetical protein [Longimicrobium sp.]
MQGRTLYDPQRQAVEKNAHAVLGETTGSTGAANAPLSGTPITWVEGNGCHE